jgi:hypothetical protein
MSDFANITGVYMNSILLVAEVVEEAQCRCMTVECVIGSRIRDVLEEAQALGRQLECGIQFQFNGHLGWIRPADDVDKQLEYLRRVWSRRE